MVEGMTIALLGLLAAEFPNDSYDDLRLLQPLVVLDGYFIIMGSADSGNAGGVIHVMDVS